VRLETVADFCREEQLQKVDFLKIDTEGYEVEVLQGARPMLATQQIRLIYLECGPVAGGDYFVSLDQVGRVLAEFDYQLFGIYEQQPSFNGERNIFFFNPLFICPDLIAPTGRL
jgi:hypothetical protein